MTATMMNQSVSINPQAWGASTSSAGPCSISRRTRKMNRRPRTVYMPIKPSSVNQPLPAETVFEYPSRSEERRVGKECRSRWEQDHDKKKRKKVAGNQRKRK